MRVHSPPLRASMHSTTNISTAASSFCHLPFAIPASVFHHVDLLLKPHQDIEFKKWMKEMEIYIEIIVGVLMTVLLVVLVGCSIKNVVGRWRERVRVREREGVEEGRRRRLSEGERRRCGETVGILRRDTGAGTPSPRRSGEGCVPKRVRFLEVEPEEEIVVQRRLEYGDAVLMVNHSFGADMGEVF